MKKTGNNWRVADILVAALIAVADGLIFWPWSPSLVLVARLGLKGTASRGQCLRPAWHYAVIRLSR
jgi:ABC-type thiamin/hydroxymethylpyrimidine transport system permease subunit